MNEFDENMSFNLILSGGVGWGGKIYECLFKGDWFCYFCRGIYSCSFKLLIKL